MTRRLVIDVPAWQLWVAAGTLMATGALVAAGVGVGGYAYGRESATTTTATTIERIYTADDLRDAASACGAEGDVVSGDKLTMPGADYAGYTRQCVIAVLDAPPRAVAEYGAITVKPEFELKGGEYTWSNVTMTWKQTDDGRDLTITVGPK